MDGVSEMSKTVNKYKAKNVAFAVLFILILTFASYIIYADNKKSDLLIETISIASKQADCLVQIRSDMDQCTDKIDEVRIYQESINTNISEMKMGFFQTQLNYMRK